MSSQLTGPSAVSLLGVGRDEYGWKEPNQTRLVLPVYERGSPLSR